jgi:hypothetical protein
MALRPSYNRQSLLRLGTICEPKRQSEFPPISLSWPISEFVKVKQKRIPELEGEFELNEKRWLDDIRNTAPDASPRHVAT